MPITAKELKANYITRHDKNPFKLKEEILNELDNAIKKHYPGELDLSYTSNITTSSSLLKTCFKENKHKYKGILIKVKKSRVYVYIEDYKITFNELQLLHAEKENNLADLILSKELERYAYIHGYKIEWTGIYYGKVISLINPNYYDFIYSLSLKYLKEKIKKLNSLHNRFLRIFILIILSSKLFYLYIKNSLIMLRLEKRNIILKQLETRKEVDIII